MTYLLDVETLANPAPAVQDNFETLDPLGILAVRLPARPLFIQTATGSVASTSAATSFLSTGVGSLVIPANSMAIGSVLKARLRGHFRTLAGVGETWAVVLSLGGMTTTFPTIGPGICGAGTQWFLEWDLVFRTIGASATAFAHGRVFYETSTLAAWDGPSIVASDTVDTTGSLTFGATVDWSTADALNAFHCTQAILELEAGV